MKAKRNITQTIVCLTIFSFIIVIWNSYVIAGTYREEFNGNKLDENIWEMKTAGQASYKVENGQLTMTSPADADGILLYWRGGDVSNGDFSVEVKVKVAQNTNNAAIIASIKKDISPTLNTAINPEWKTVFWCGSNTPGWYINNDSWKNSGIKGPELEGVWKIALTGDTFRCYFNGSEVVVFDKVQEPRFLCFGPDVYTSHYAGEMTVDWIELSGPMITNITSVTAERKLSNLWGNIKNGK